MTKFSRRNLLKMLSAAPLAGGVGINLSACGGPSKDRINIYTWDTYTGENTVDDFEAATQSSVNLSYFANNDELFAKMRVGNPGFDLIVPSNDFVERLIAADLLEKLDHSKIPNLKNIAPEFMDVPYDPGRQYSVPYTWLITGLGYRKSKVDSVPDSWKWVFDSDRYKGRIGLLGEASELFELAIKYQGHSVNDTDPDVIESAADMLMRQKPNIAMFHDDNGQDALLAGDVDIVIEYNGDIAQVMQEDDDIDFVVPKEGSILASDGFCIPKGARNPDLAHQFINFILDAKNGAHIAETIQYPTPNEAALALMPNSYRDNKAIFPPQDVLSVSEYVRDPGMEVNRIFSEYLTRIRSA
ncbi:ABC transporter substrate-binding protein [Henriciella litoralis]|uniref:ABC transporter substrate-binding protein n=1 Tax=Henriciella litoralis TaxID=568102 RepID=UPI000A06D6CF|nr:spermidine/putrescine ABC transporter substrate-binding protein [Henriciella litoralis]